jgi:hypothetical protein
MELQGATPSSQETKETVPSDEEVPNAVMDIERHLETGATAGASSEV